jgi:predicted O-linked N-acetylglucosamine transferase (SPINDLY family)
MTAQTDYAAILHLIWQRRLDFVQLVEYASQLENKHLGGLAAVLYQTWLQRNPGPHDYFAAFNLGVLLANEGDPAGARDAYLKAIERAPNFLQAHVNLGLAYERLGQFDEAVARWQWVERHAAPDKADERATLVVALNNLGRLLETRRNYFSALAALDKSLSLEPTQPDTLHHWVFLREKQCLWPVYRPIGEVSLEAMRAATSALATLSLSDDPEAQLTAARHYAAHKIPVGLPQLAPPVAYRHERIRLAYCSSDLCQHPVAMLTVELFELHDREKFEIYIFDWSPEDGSDLRARIRKAADHFIRIDALTDLDAAKLIREHEIDILIDLQGQTQGARATLLACRPAPIQITWLGLPATTGLPCIDYVLADRFLIPEESARHYSETPLYLPIYQPSDRQRQHAPPPSRRACGLPETGFVFCCHNNNYKYTPELFATWMNILRRVPGSLLWLLADNPWAMANLQHEAELAGIDGHRLVFALRDFPPVFRARLSVADLFLDTFPFNAGTTANDALWMGLPVLTLAGRSFASRMAGALLTAAGLPELIAHTLAEYEDQAVALAHAPEEIARLRGHLAQVRQQGLLFDSPAFVRNLEKELVQLLSQKQETKVKKTRQARAAAPVSTGKKKSP